MAWGLPFHCGVVACWALSRSTGDRRKEEDEEEEGKELYLC